MYSLGSPAPPPRAGGKLEVLCAVETTPFFIFLFVHLTGLVLGFGSVMVTDLYGLLWMRDRVWFPQLIRVSGVTEKFIWGGWGLMVAAGVPLLVLKGVVDELLIVKLVLVGLIGINGVPLYFLQKRLRGYSEGDEVPRVVMFRLTLCLFVSQVGWWGAMLIGFLHRHVQTVIRWPQSPWLVSGAVVGALLLLWVGGEAVLRRRGEG